MAKVDCPNCDAKFELGNRLVGDRFDCPECEVELEVVTVEPPVVSWAYDSDNDDWEQEDDEDDEDDN